jgi:predicted AAA+ superfamily ATPase
VVFAKVSQTLEGRTAIVHLLPFSLDELLGLPSRDPWAWNELPERRETPAFNFETMLYRGFCSASGTRFRGSIMFILLEIIIT